MKYFLITLFFQLFVAHVVARDIDFNSMYHQLDNLIDNSGRYVNSHETNLKRLRTLLQEAKDDKSRYDLSFSLYLGY
jgi:hypothetical protein